jgi:hypothetical protein
MIDKLKTISLSFCKLRHFEPRNLDTKFSFEMLDPDPYLYNANGSSPTVIMKRKKVKYVKIFVLLFLSRMLSPFPKMEQ